MLPESLWPGPSIRLDHLIFEVRGIQVMIDRDLARLYGVETRVSNQVVRCNVKRSRRALAFFLYDKRL